MNVQEARPQHGCSVGVSNHTCSFDVVSLVQSETFDVEFGGEPLRIGAEEASGADEEEKEGGEEEGEGSRGAEGSS